MVDEEAGEAMSSSVEAEELAAVSRSMDSVGLLVALLPVTTASLLAADAIQWTEAANSESGDNSRLLLLLRRRRLLQSLQL